MKELKYNEEVSPKPCLTNMEGRRSKKKANLKVKFVIILP